MSRILFTPALLLVLAAGAARASNPTALDQLLQLVPRDAAGILAIEDFRAQRQAFAESPLFQQIQSLPGYRRWLDSEAYTQLHGGFEAIDRQVRQDLGISAPELLDDLLGQAVVLVLRPGPADRPLDLSGMLLTRARNAELLVRAMKMMNEVQRRTGELQDLRQHSHGTATIYEKSLLRNGQPSTEYYALLDEVGVLSNSRQAVEAVIDQRGKPGGGLGSLPLYRDVRRQLPAAAAISLFLPARSWDGVVGQVLGGLTGQTEVGPGANATFWLRQWQGVEAYGAVWSFDPARGFRSADALKLNLTRLSPGLKGMVLSLRGELGILRHVPGSSIAVLAGRIDLPAIQRWQSERLTRAERERLEAWRNVLGSLMGGKNVATDLDPYLGPETVLYVAPAPAPAEPPELVWAAQIRSGPGNAAARGGIENVLKTLFNLVALQKPKKGAEYARVTTTPERGIRVVWLSGGDLPPWLQPASAVSSDFLVLGSSPTAVRRFIRQSAESSLGEAVGKDSPAAPSLTSSGQAFSLNVDALVRELRTHRSVLEAGLTQRDRLSLTQARERLDQGIDFLGLFHSVQAVRWYDEQAGSVRGQGTLWTTPASAQRATPQKGEKP